MVAKMIDAMQQYMLHRINMDAILVFIEMPRARDICRTDRRDDRVPSRPAPHGRSIAMTEATAKTKTKPAPHFEAPFANIASEAPAAFRDIAEKSLSQAKDNYEKIRSAAEQATGVLETTYATAAKGASDYNMKMLEAFRANANAAFDFAGQLFAAKTVSDLVELSTSHARKQFETLSAQTRELASLAQKVTTESVEPLKEGIARVTRKVA
jgi:phasin